MSYPVNFFSQPIQIIKYAHSVANGFPIATGETININAVVQPMGVTEKREMGFDMWIEAVMVHCFLDLDIDDTIIHHNRRYTIRAKGNYSDYGYYEYYASADTEKST
jgi:hypothetical protein